MCAVTIKFKTLKEVCVFVVLGKGHALLGMPDTAALKIIDINVDSIQHEKEECNTNIGNARESNTANIGCVSGWPSSFLFFPTSATSKHFLLQTPVL